MILYLYSFQKAHIKWVFSKALKCSNKTLDIGAMTHKNTVHTLNA